MSSELESTITNTKLEEYRALREEVLHALQFRIWGVASYSVFSGALLSFATVNNIITIYLFPIALAIPYILYTAYIERIRIRIHTYIEVFIEGTIRGMNYETNLKRFRKAHESSRWYRIFDRPRYALSLIGVYLIMALLCFAFIFVLQDALWVRIVGSGLILLIFFSLRFYVEVVTSTERYRKMWNDLIKEQNTKEGVDVNH